MGLSLNPVKIPLKAAYSLRRGNQMYIKGSEGRIYRLLEQCNQPGDVSLRRHLVQEFHGELEELHRNS